MTKPKVIDLDADLGFAEQPAHTVVVQVLGEEFTLNADLNQFALATIVDGGTVKDLVNFLRSLIVPGEWARFEATALASQALRGDPGVDNLIKLTRKLTEAVAGRPTKQPSASPRGGSNRSAKPRSPAATGSARGRTSTISR